jgi:hypothetical protein
MTWSTCVKDGLCRLRAKAGNYCTKFGHWEAIFLSKGTKYLPCLDQLEKKA